MLTLILFSTLGVLAGIGFIRTFRQLKSFEGGSDRSGHLLKNFDRLKSAIEQGAASERLARLLVEECEEFRSGQPGFALSGEGEGLDKTILLLHGVVSEIHQGKQPLQTLETARTTMAQYLDWLNEQGNAVRSRLINPVQLISGGITSLLILPLKPFRSFGLIDKGTLTNFESGLVVRMVSQAGSILGLISTALSIIFQWLDYYRSVFSILQY